MSKLAQKEMFPVYLRAPGPRERGARPRSDLPGITAEKIAVGGRDVWRYIGELWTARQRQAASIHEVSYRACFKAQLPRFFIDRFTEEGDVVYDPFSGRGTTAIEAGMAGRRVIANDVNPLSEILCAPRFFVPDLKELGKRLANIPMDTVRKADMDLSMFYHPRTEAEIVCLRDYLAACRASGEEDLLDCWIRMVATNRLTGHSKGFFSVYTLPPNQAVSPERQQKINARRKQTPPYRRVGELILRKSASLIKRLTAEEVANLRQAGEKALFLTKDARETSEIEAESVQLTVTSPPFLNVVQYSSDNWLRCWFNGIDDKAISARITEIRDVAGWGCVMGQVFEELHRVTRKGGWVAFEVGEVQKGAVRLEEVIAPIAVRAGFHCESVLVNLQRFTKTSNIWGIRNNRGGTNTNRIVLLRK